MSRPEIVLKPICVNRWKQQDDLEATWQNEVDDGIQKLLQYVYLFGAWGCCV